MEKTQYDRPAILPLDEVKMITLATENKRVEDVFRCVVYALNCRVWPVPGLRAADYEAGDSPALQEKGYDQNGQSHFQFTASFQ